jgi:hypothetical protein
MGGNSHDSQCIAADLAASAQSRGSSFSKSKTSHDKTPPVFQGPPPGPSTRTAFPFLCWKAAPVRSLYRARATVGGEGWRAVPMDKKCRFNRDVRKACRCVVVCNLMIGDGR